MLRIHSGPRDWRVRLAGPSGPRRPPLALQQPASIIRGIHTQHFVLFINSTQFKNQSMNPENPEAAPIDSFNSKPFTLKSNSLNSAKNKVIHSFLFVSLQKVWLEYQACSGGSKKDALCICSVEVRSFGASSSGETFRLERCHRLRHHQQHPKRTMSKADSGRWSLPHMSLVGPGPKRRHFRVLESRQGKMITVTLESMKMF